MPPAVNPMVTGRSSPLSCPASGVVPDAQPLQRGFEILLEIRKGTAQRLRPGNDDVVMPRPDMRRDNRLDRRAQAPTRPVATDGIADTPAGGDADAHRTLRVVAAIGNTPGRETVVQD